MNAEELREALKASGVTINIALQKALFIKDKSSHPGKTKLSKCSSCKKEQKLKLPTIFLDL